MDDGSPEKIGGYHVLRRVGLGGMAEVYVGAPSRDAVEQEHVCVKIVRRDRAPEARIVSLFNCEARLHLALQHPNIVRAMARGHCGVGEFLVMELVRGVNLEKLLFLCRDAHVRLSHRVAVYILRETLKGLSYAHTLAYEGVPLKVIHRDLSPSNILISSQGEVKVADFGIAKSVIASDVTTLGRIRGKVHYMSPEQCRGEPLDPRTDLFSLGVIAYEMLGGQHPFVRPSDQDEISGVARLLENKREPIKSVARSLPKRVGKWVEDMLAPEPAGRPASADEAFMSLEGGALTGTEREELASLVTICVGRGDRIVPRALGAQDAYPKTKTQTIRSGAAGRDAGFRTPNPEEPRPFQASDFNEVDALLSRVPADARVRGFMFDVVRHVLTARGQDCSALPSQPFALYPQRAYLEALLQAARVLNPWASDGERLFELGRMVYPLFARNLVGRAIFAVGRPEYATFVRLCPRAYEVASAQARVSVLEVLPASAKVALNDAWDFVPYTCGIFVGAMRVCGVTLAGLSVRVAGDDKVLLNIAWNWNGPEKVDDVLV